MQILRPSIQRYAWGTEKYIPELLGIESDGRPYAELWYGSHPLSPSVDAFGAPFTQRLPYLLKVLSIATPLSIQVHPTKAQAEEGFKRENDLGIDIDSPARNYKDQNHKPETIVALQGGLEARAGIRSAEQIDDLIASFGHTALEDVWLSQDVGMNPGTLIEVVLGLDRAKVYTLIQELCTSLVNSHFAEVYVNDARWLERCAELYANDPGVIVQLLMNYVHLEPGEGLHMEAGQLHAYLKGNGVEIMGESDNVVRAGLTPKNIDIAELLSIANLEASPPNISNPSDGIYTQNVPDYKLHRIVRGESTTIESDSISLCLEGLVKVRDNHDNQIATGPGNAVFSDSPALIASTGLVFIAMSNS